MGSGEPWHKKAELYEFGTSSWLNVDDYPFGRTWVFDYHMVFIPETSSYYVVGGEDGVAFQGAGYLSQIGKFKDAAWSDGGRLNVPRSVSSYDSFFSRLLIQF